MESNPYQPSLVSDAVKGTQLAPRGVLATAVTLLTLYLPLLWIAFTDRSVFVSDWLAFVLTLPGEWYAQRCGARAYDYYFFAGLATICLLSLGIYFGKRSWFAFGIVNAMLTVSSTLTAFWLWQQLSAY